MGGDPGPGPLWVPPAPRFDWTIGLVATLAVALAASAGVIVWAVIAIPYSPGLTYLLDVVGILAIEFALTTYFLFVPQPAPALFLFPAGIRTGRADRGRIVPWDDIALAGHTLYMGSARCFERGAWVLDPRGESWLRFYLARYPFAR